MAVYVFGINTCSQLGIGNEIFESDKPIELKFFEQMKVKKVRCGSMHTLLLLENGELYSWGCNDEGALGRKGDESKPAQVQINEKVVDMGCGVSISAAVTENGYLYIFGTFRDHCGILGLQQNTKISFDPIKTILKKIQSISVGEAFVTALNTIGCPYTFGSNDFGELGRKTSTRKINSSLIPTPITAATTKATKYKFKSIASGSFHTLALNYNDEVYGWGSNIYGQLANSCRDPKVEKVLLNIKDVDQIVAGSQHSLVTTKGGDLYACGRNQEYQLGFDSGKKDVPELKKVELSNVKRVRSHSYFNIAQVGNDLYSWGTAYYGSLGLGPNIEVAKEPTKMIFNFNEIIDLDLGNDFVVILTK